MTTVVPEAGAPLRRAVYLLVGAAAVAVMVAKIVGAENVVEPSRYAPPTVASYGADRADKPLRKWPTTRPEPTPMYGSNDRSRWAAVRALADRGTAVIGTRTADPDMEVNSALSGPAGYTAVRLRAAPNTPPGLIDSGIVFEGGYQSLDKVMNPETGEFFSSKPPLFTVLLAGEYRLLKLLSGWDIVRDRWLVVCTILLTVNALPFAVYLLLLSRLIEQIGTTDFGRLFAFVVAAFGTFLVTFSPTLNNHNPAAYCTLFAVYPLLRHREGKAESVADLAVSGFFAGLLACLELPAAALTAALLGVLLYARPKRTLAAFVSLMLVPVAALFACNFLTLGRWLPTYSDFGGPWYEFDGSHWAKLKAGVRPTGIDFADEPKWVYALHLMLGHHGWLSLTPAFVASLGGFALLARRSWHDVRVVALRRIEAAAPVFTAPLLSAVTAAVSLTVFAFYVAKTNNYGGFTSGPRWLFWLIPLWVLAAVPAADRWGRSKWGRVLMAVLLGLSVLSAFYPAWNPWRPPWLLQLFERAGWVSYDLPAR